MDRRLSGISTCEEAAPTDLALRVCSLCGDRLPLSKFRLRSSKATTHDGRCRPCYNAYMREYRSRRLAAKAGPFVVGLNRARDLDRVAVVCKAMLNAYGGVDGLATAWRDYVVRVSTERPGSPRALQAMQATLNLLAIAEGKSAS